MAKFNNSLKSYGHLGKYSTSEDPKIISLYKYPYCWTTHSMEFSKMSFCFTSLVNSAISVELYGAAAEVSLFFLLFFFLGILTVIWNAIWFVY